MTFSAGKESHRLLLIPQPLLALSTPSPYAQGEGFLFGASFSAAASRVFVEPLRYVWG